MKGAVTQEENKNENSQGSFSDEFSFEDENVNFE